MYPARQGNPVRPLRTPGRFWYVSFVGFLSMALFSIAIPKHDLALETAELTSMVPEPEKSSNSHSLSADTMDDAVHLIESACKRFRNVRDYTCRLIERERLEGILMPETTFAMYVRNQPFSVRLKWLEPKATKGQEAIYVDGRNNGKLLVRGAGLLGIVGFVSIDINDARAQRSSRHNIKEAGFGNLIEQFGAGWPAERDRGLTKVRIDEFNFAGRSCKRVETVHLTNPDNYFLFERSVLYFDNETHLPIRVENYDWPARAGMAGELLEEYSYLDVRLNPGLSDEAFNP